MKKRCIFKTLLLNIFILCMSPLSVCAKENLPAPGKARLDYIIKASGKPPVELYIGLGVLALLIVIAVAYYKYVEKREENGQK